MSSALHHSPSSHSSEFGLLKLLPRYARIGLVMYRAHHAVTDSQIIRRRIATAAIQALFRHVPALLSDRPSKLVSRCRLQITAAAAGWIAAFGRRSGGASLAPADTARNPFA